VEEEQVVGKAGEQDRSGDPAQPCLLCKGHEPFSRQNGEQREERQQEAQHLAGRKPRSQIHGREK
jgi:hypothetical protein